uniref:Ribonucleoside-diphosphate reductase n=1 Tax=Spodoptera frugiperda nuclear polyhedrosis virus TaxID=10455 RepID=B2KX75_NPVSF|nr:RR-1 [Spodoptera frugiperda multiple nucleopolyhedrovirus]QWS70792.1 rr1 [Spodoptera frugiperda multiple nucleopolyhedrovirus]
MCVLDIKASCRIVEVSQQLCSVNEKHLTSNFAMENLSMDPFATPANDATQNSQQENNLNDILPEELFNSNQEYYNNSQDYVENSQEQEQQQQVGEPSEPIASTSGEPSEPIASTSGEPESLFTPNVITEDNNEDTEDENEDVPEKIVEDSDDEDNDYFYNQYKKLHETMELQKKIKKNLCEDRMRLDKPEYYLSTDYTNVCRVTVEDTSNFDKEVVQIVTEMHEDIHESFQVVMKNLYHKNEIGQRLYCLAMVYGEELNKVLRHDRDYTYDLRLYENKNNLLERVQHMFMRVALTMYGDDIQKVIESYHMMSLRMYAHSDLAFACAGTNSTQLANDYKLYVDNCSDNIFLSYKIIQECATIMNCGGAVDLYMQNVSVKMLPVFNNMVRHILHKNKIVKLPTIHIELWHHEVKNFIETIRNNSDKVNFLQFTVDIPDIFMNRVKNNGYWTLLDPESCTSLSSKYGDKFEQAYVKFEKEHINAKIVKAKDLLKLIIDTMRINGNLSVMFKDTFNNNFSIEDEQVKYNIVFSASVAVDKCVNLETKQFDYNLLRRITKNVVRDLDAMININMYPLDKFENKKHNIAVGMQGFAETLLLLGYTFDMVEAKALNKLIAETIYYGAIEASNELAEASKELNESGKKKSHRNEKITQQIYNVYTDNETLMWDWQSLHEKVERYGVKHVTFVSNTYKTAFEILGTKTTSGPFNSFLYQIEKINYIEEVLVRALAHENLNTPTVINSILATKNGSVQNNDLIPDHIKKVFKLNTETDCKQLDYMIENSPYIDQTQELILHDTNYDNIYCNILKAWQNKLKINIKCHKIDDDENEDKDNNDEDNEDDDYDSAPPQKKQRC